MFAEFAGLTTAVLLFVVVVVVVLQFAKKITPQSNAAIVKNFTLRLFILFLTKIFKLKYQIENFDYFSIETIIDHIFVKFTTHLGSKVTKKADYFDWSAVLLFKITSSVALLSRRR